MQATINHRVLVCVLLLALPSPAQTFSGDFESGTVLRTDLPAGSWDGVSNSNGATSIGVAAEAAHRGRFGLRVDDPHAGGAGGGPVASASAASRPTAAPAFYARSWVRVARGAGAGYCNILVGRAYALAEMALEVRLAWPGPKLFVGGFTSSGSHELSPSAQAIPFSEDVWHLVEVAVT